MFNQRDAFNNSLSMRWFTPRGQSLREALLTDLRRCDGENLREILEPLRRPGVDDSSLDLRGIDLERECLAGVSLASADLSGAILVECNLQLVDLTRANLSGARLTGAVLRRARLLHANLAEADLRRVDLNEADLEGACFRSARVSEASFRRALIKDADFTDVDLHEIDLSVAFRSRAPSSTRKHTRTTRSVGRPPQTEPRRPTRHLPPRKSAKLIRFDPSQRQVEADEGATSFDEALAKLLSSRNAVERITAVIDGVEYVLMGDARRSQRYPAV